MMESFSIIFVKTVDFKVDRSMFLRAIDEFKKEYEPASWVTISEVEHMGTTYEPNTFKFTHSFSVSWEDPKQ